MDSRSIAVHMVAFKLGRKQTQLLFPVAQFPRKIVKEMYKVDFSLILIAEDISRVLIG